MWKCNVRHGTLQCWWKCSQVCYMRQGKVRALSQMAAVCIVTYGKCKSVCWPRSAIPDLAGRGCRQGQATDMNRGLECILSCKLPYSRWSTTAPLNSCSGEEANTPLLWMLTTCADSEWWRGDHGLNVPVNKVGRGMSTVCVQLYSNLWCCLKRTTPLCQILMHLLWCFRRHTRC